MFVEKGGKIDQPKNTGVAGDRINCVVAEGAGRQRGERFEKLAGGKGTTNHVLKLHGGKRRESRFENPVPGCSEIDITGGGAHLQLDSLVVGKALIVDIPKSFGNRERKGRLEIDGKILKIHGAAVDLEISLKLVARQLHVEIGTQILFGYGMVEDQARFDAGQPIVYLPVFQAEGFQRVKAEPLLDVGTVVLLSRPGTLQHPYHNIRVPGKLFLHLEQDTSAVISPGYLSRFSKVFGINCSKGKVTILRLDLDVAADGGKLDRKVEMQQQLAAGFRRHIRSGRVHGQQLERGGAKPEGVHPFQGISPQRGELFAQDHRIFGCWKQGGGRLEAQKARAVPAIDPLDLWMNLHHLGFCCGFSQFAGRDDRLAEQDPNTSLYILPGHDPSRGVFRNLEGSFRNSTGGDLLGE